MAGGPGLDHCEIRATQVLQPLKRLHFREACWVALEALIVSKEQQQLRGTEREVRAVAMPYQHCPSRDSFSHRWNSTQQRFSERFWEQFTFSGGMYMLYILGFRMFRRPTGTKNLVDRSFTENTNWSHKYSDA